jgi:hypothetical protein
VLHPPPPDADAALALVALEGRLALADIAERLAADERDPRVAELGEVRERSLDAGDVSTLTDGKPSSSEPCQIATVASGASRRSLTSTGSSVKSPSRITASQCRASRTCVSASASSTRRAACPSTTE